MSIVTPKTNFIDLLEEVIGYLDSLEDEAHKSIMNRCAVALQELYDIDRDIDNVVH